MQKIIPCLWFNDNAESAVGFYISVFKNSKVISTNRYGKAGPGPSGSVMTEIFRLEDREFMALNGGPEFTINLTMSLYINCETEQEVDGLWDKLSAGGKVLIPMSQYPFSKKYGWIQDSFGVSWQLNLGGAQQKISPLLMFTGKQNGRAEEAIDFYISIFKNSSKNEIYRYEKGEGGTEGSIKHSRFMLDGQSFMAMDSSIEHAFTFSPATSLFINCETQTEVDELWEKLAEDGGEHGVCGWLTDKFGVSWQIVPTILGRLLGDSDPAKAQRVMKAMLKMKKIDIEGLQKAYEKNNS